MWVIPGHSMVKRFVSYGKIAFLNSPSHCTQGIVPPHTAIQPLRLELSARPSQLSLYPQISEGPPCTAWICYSCRHLLEHNYKAKDGPKQPFPDYQSAPFHCSSAKKAALFSHWTAQNRQKDRWWCWEWATNIYFPKFTFLFYSDIFSRHERKSLSGLRES